MSQHFQNQLRQLIAQAEADADVERQIMMRVAHILDNYARAKGELVASFGHLLARESEPMATNVENDRHAALAQRVASAEAVEAARWQQERRGMPQ